MAQNRIYAGMPDADYEKECKALFKESGGHTSQKSHSVEVIDSFDGFEKFINACANASFDGAVIAIMRTKSTDVYEG